MIELHSSTGHPYVYPTLMGQLEDNEQDKRPNLSRLRQLDH